MARLARITIVNISLPCYAAGQRVPSIPEFCPEFPIGSQEKDMIARIWRGKATTEKAKDYQRHFTLRVAPHLKELAGHRGAYLLRREDDGGVEFVAVTLWDSMDSVRAFSGQNPDVAIVEPEAVLHCQASMTSPGTMISPTTALEVRCDSPAMGESLAL